MRKISNEKRGKISEQKTMRFHFDPVRNVINAMSKFSNHQRFMSLPFLYSLSTFLFLSIIYKLFRFSGPGCVRVGSNDDWNVFFFWCAVQRACNSDFIIMIFVYSFPLFFYPTGLIWRSIVVEVDLLCATECWNKFS